MEEKIAKTKLLIGLAEIFNFKFSEGSLSIYLAVLQKLASQELSRSIEEGLTKNRWQFMPKPGEFFTSGEASILDDARDSAHLAWSAISRYGRHNSDAAEKYMGALAWTVIGRMGGWTTVCCVYTDEKGVWIAQFRDLAQSLSRKAERRDLDRKPELPRPTSEKNLNNLLTLTSKIGDPK